MPKMPTREELQGLSLDEIFARRAEMLEAAASVYEEWARFRQGAAEAPSTVVPPAESATNDALIKLPLADAAIECLKGAKKPMTPKQIWALLSEAGRETDAERPSRSVTGALRKALATNDDLFHVGFGKWHLKSKYSPKMLKKMLSTHSGTGGVSHDDHVRKTREGLERARAKGRSLGAKPKLNPEKVRELRRLLEARNMTVAKCCAAVGITMNTYYRLRRDIQVWREGDPWPPPPERYAQTDDSNVVRLERRIMNEAPSG